MRFVVGEPWNTSVATKARRIALGHCLASMAKALSGVEVSTARRRTHRWDLTAASALRRPR